MSIYAKSISATQFNIIDQDGKPPTPIARVCRLRTGTRVYFGFSCDSPHIHFPNVKLLSQSVAERAYREAVKISRDGGQK